MLVARHFFPQALIVSFEPLTEPAETYRKIFWRDELANVRQLAIGPQTGQARMHVSARDDSSSLLPIAAEQERVFPGTASVGTRDINVATLGECLTTAIPDPALLKLDVQGFELEALRGCESLLDSFQWIYVECSFRELYAGQASADEVVAWLRERSFALRGLYNAGYDGDGRAVQADFLFGRAGSIGST
jgi:FkbM family methyltransferase